MLISAQFLNSLLLYGKKLLSLLYDSVDTSVLLTMKADSTSLKSSNSLILCRDIIVFDFGNYSKQI
jgi:hypothetical protein